jgi:transposase InsO family protein
VELKPIVDARGNYGYRRVTALLNRQGLPRVNHKHVYRVMKQAELLLAQHTGKPTRTHDGKIITLKSNLRWCSDSFEVRCWNGERVQVAFSLDCHDREAMRFVATTEAITGEIPPTRRANSAAASGSSSAQRPPTAQRAMGWGTSL